MTRTLRDTLRQLAAGVPEPRLPLDFYHQARRTHRRRIAAAGLTAAAAVIVTGWIAVGSVADRQPVPGVPAAPTGGSMPFVVDHWLAWSCLGLLLAGLGLWWRRRGVVRLTIRLVAVAAAGAVLITTAPPGIAWWGEPRRAPGLPSTVVVPSTWAARATDSPPGRAAVLFGGPATFGDFEEGRIAMVAADGDRYRTLEEFTYAEPGEMSTLSPDGRYVDWMSDVFDLSTGRKLGSPALVAAWSPDSTRYLYWGEPEVDAEGTSQAPTKLGLWDVKQKREVASFAVTPRRGSMRDEVAFSRDGTQLAVHYKDGRQLDLYRIGESKPYRSLPVGDAKLAGREAWTPDGRGIALVELDTCTRCPLPWYRSRFQLTLIDVASGQAMGNRGYPALSSVTHMRILGWRTDSQPVVAVGDPGRTSYFDGTKSESIWWGSQDAENIRVVVLDPDAGPEPLLTLPKGVTDVDIASDYLREPIQQARPATSGPPNNPWLLAALASAAVALTLTVGSIWFVVRAIGKHRRIQTPPPVSDRG